jgi:hypothetical protein
MIVNYSLLLSVPIDRMIKFNKIKSIWNIFILLNMKLQTFAQNIFSTLELYGKDNSNGLNNLRENQLNGVNYCNSPVLQIGKYI